MVSCADGVGTKLKIAKLAGVHNTVGIDLVAMSVNDAICCGAEPLFFLDYIAMSHDDPDIVEQLVEGISDGCVMGDCALLGGETAIMPDMYTHGDYDLAGFCVGVVERRNLIDGKSISPSDVLIGVASNGVHSNGYSLVRKVVFEMEGLGVDDHVAELDCTVGQALLLPTRIYSRPIRDVLSHYPVKNVVHGIAHITGGGVQENLRRILPENVRAEIDRDAWPAPPVFDWLQRLGEIDADEMDRVFNMGLGLVLAVSSYYAENIIRIMADAGFESFIIGEVREGPGDVVWKK